MNQAPDLTLQEAEPLHYDKRTVLFSWLSLAVGYLYCRTFFITDRPFYGFLFTLLLFAFGALAIRSPKPIKKDTLRALFLPFADGAPQRERGGITKKDFYLDGLSGTDGAKEKREALALRLSLPPDMTANALLDALNMLYSREDYRAILETL